MKIPKIPSKKERLRTTLRIIAGIVIYAIFYPYISQTILGGSKRIIGENGLFETILNGILILPFLQSSFHFLCEGILEFNSFYDNHDNR
jgi:hypothetical protein